MTIRSVSASCMRIDDSSHAIASRRAAGPSTRGSIKNGRNRSLIAFAFSGVRLMRTRRSQFSSAHCHAIARPVPPPAPIIITRRSRTSTENSARMARRNPSPSVFAPTSFLSRSRIVFTDPTRLANSFALSICPNPAILCGTVRFTPSKSRFRKNRRADLNSFGRI